jgi:preprotein translocase subunit YajC
MRSSFPTRHVAFHPPVIFYLRILIIPVIILLVPGCKGPAITNFTPQFGVNGTSVTVQGTGLVANGNPSGTTVQIGGVVQPVTSVTNTQLQFNVAPGSQTGFIKVTNGTGQGTSHDQFDVVDNAFGTSDTFVFGGVNTVMAAGVEHTGRDQPVLIGVLRAKWSASTGDFAFFQPDVDGAFNRMNSFWDEASFAKVSFQKNYLTTSIIDVPKSMDYYYHRFQQRNIRGTQVENIIHFPADKSLTIKSDGQDVVVNFTAGDVNRADIPATVNAAITAAIAANPGMPPPSFTFTIAGGNSFMVNTTIAGKAEGKIELEGNAIPFLGFGDGSLYNTGSGAPAKVITGTPLNKNAVTFPADQQLIITTLGQTTTVNFPAGIKTIAEIISAINAAYPGEALQQPFDVEAKDDPLNSANQFLVFKTHVDGDDDNGFKITAGGTAQATLGFGSAGVILRYEPETFRGYQSISDGFNVFASTLPAGTDLNAIFGTARMFVSVFADDNQFRAHFAGGTFHIQGDSYDTYYFACRISDSPGPVFAHETGHSLGFPDLYIEDATVQIGNPPGNWDIMDCSRCDAHPVSWLKGRHNEDAMTRTGPWTDDSHIAKVVPVAAGNVTKTFILTPNESPWISSNPFAATHPGIELVHSVELIPADEKDVFMIECRQKGIYKADQLGAQIDFSRDLPSEGVIFYEARRIPTGGLAHFIPVNLLSPMFDPLTTVGEQLEHVITNSNKINIRVVEKLQNPDMSGGAPSFSYVIEVKWGEGSFYDLAITPWNPPPWESVDIWVDNNAQNDWNVYTYHDAAGNPIENGDNVAVNKVNRLYAKVHNLGDIAVTSDVQVIWRIAVPQTAGDNIVTELGRVTIPGGIPAKSFVVTPPFEWKPTSSNDEHVCIKAEIVSVAGELNATLNNIAQENLTQWYSGASSPFDPVVFKVMVKNPYKDRSTDIRMYAPKVPKGWTVTVSNVNFRLQKNEEKEIVVKVKPYLSYFQQNGQLKERKIIPSFYANVQAEMPVGDKWVPIGGVTAVVHPVNKDSRISIKLNKEIRDSLQIDGIISSSGPLTPPLGNREIHIRLEDAAKNVKWVRGRTDASGRFSVQIPVNVMNNTRKIIAYCPGGAGFNPSQSNELDIN